MLRLGRGDSRRSWGLFKITQAIRSRTSPRGTCKVTPSRCRQGLSGNTACVKAEGNTGKGRAVGKDHRERCLRSTVSNWVGKLETAGAWGVPDGPGMGSNQALGESMRVETTGRSWVKEADWPTVQALHTGAAAANPRDSAYIMSVARTFGQHQLPWPGLGIIAKSGGVGLLIMITAGWMGLWGI